MYEIGKILIGYLAEIDLDRHMVKKPNSVKLTISGFKTNVKINQYIVILTK